MSGLSQIVESGLSTRQVNEGVQNNYNDFPECSYSPESEKTHQNISWFETKFYHRIISWWKLVTTPICDDQDQGAVAHDSQNSRPDPNLKNIENWLNRFDLPTILPKLEKSLEGVKRNKISKESHEQLSKSLDKDLLRLSLKFHPDHAGDHECQSALNAIRKVLKTLTVVFLGNTFIDYKYEYFSKLDISTLVNENEINNTIETVLYKISELSETKRMNIIGEIRKFLIESEKCVKSYFKDNKSDFEKYRDYALYHLQKNIEGYKKLEKEYNILIEECSKENDSMTAIVQSMARQSERESKILRSLERVARSSFQGNFEIFSVEEAMEEYYILPFVGYVNVLSMYNLLLQPEFSCFPLYFFSCNTRELRLSTKAYITDSLKINAKELMSIIKEEIFQVLRKDYSVDAYNEGKSNRAEMHEKILALKKILGDLQEKEKTLEEHLNRYKMEREKCSESFVNYSQYTEKSLKVDMTKQKECEENTSKFNSHLEGGEILKKSYESQEELSETPSVEENCLTTEDSEVAQEVGEDCLNFFSL